MMVVPITWKLDLQSKSMNWFLHNQDLRHERVNANNGQQKETKLLVLPIDRFTSVTYLRSSCNSYHLALQQLQLKYRFPILRRG